MVLLNTSPHDSFGLSKEVSRGFSLFEVIIVMAIAALLLGVGMFLSFDLYKAYLFRSERGLLVSSLERARSRAMANYYESSWVFCYDNPSYNLVRGSSCSGGTLVDSVAGSPGMSVSGVPSSGVVFSQLSGKTSAATLTVTDGIRSSTITINEHGTIIW